VTDSILFLRITLSVLIGGAIFAGIFTAVKEWQWLKQKNRLNREAIGEMILSLSPLPVTGLVSVIMTPYWYLIYKTAGNIAILNIPISIASIISAMILVDFSYYWEHRCAHRIPLLWKLYHAPHHSSRACTVATAYRVSFVNQFFAPAFYLPWLFLGFEPVVILGFQLFVFHYQAWLHTEIFGPHPSIDLLLNTPANHRMHHSRAIEHRDVNLGAILMLWDRLFGTYKAPEKNLLYGIYTGKPPRKFWQIYTYPWLGDTASDRKSLYKPASHQ